MCRKIMLGIIFYHFIVIHFALTRKQRMKMNQKRPDDNADCDLVSV